MQVLHCESIVRMNVDARSAGQLCCSCARHNPWPQVKTVCSHPLQARQVLVQIPYHVSILRGADDAESVGQMICEKADELRAVAIIMAAHNKGRLVRFIVGSTTQYCIRNSHVTVLVMQNN